MMTYRSGAQVVSIVAWVSALAAAWYGLLSGDGWSTMVIGVLALSVLIGTLAGALHEGKAVARQKATEKATTELTRAAIERMSAKAGDLNVNGPYVYDKNGTRTGLRDRGGR